MIAFLVAYSLARSRFRGRNLFVQSFLILASLPVISYLIPLRNVLDVLQKSAPSRIVNVASTAHKYGKLDINSWVTGRDYSTFGSYANSKLANVLFTYELARRLEGTGVTANCLHPGGVGTNLFRGLPKFMQALIKLVTISPERGARTSIYLASSREVEGVTGKYFARRRQQKSSEASHNEEAAHQLWEVSEELTGIRSGSQTDGSERA